MKAATAALGRKARRLGWFCVFGMTLLITDLLANLPYMPAEWWLPPDEVQLPPGHFDLRMMIICPGPTGWLGTWGYLGAWLWLPYAAWRTFRSLRVGAVMRPHERVLIAVAAVLVVAIQFLLRGTPLRYAYPLI